MNEYEQLLNTLGVETQEQAMAEIGRLHAAALAIAGAQNVLSAVADFDDMTWTFNIEPDCRVSGGMYALVPVPPNGQAKPPGAAVCDRSA